MWKLDHREGWALKNWCFWIVVLEKTLDSPLDSTEIKPVNPKGNQPWIFIGRTDAEAEVPIFWPPDVKSWLIGKDPGSGKDWGQEEKKVTKDEVVGWHHGLNGREFEQASGDGEGQGSLACCNLWVTKTRTWLSNWTTPLILFLSMASATSMLPNPLTSFQFYFFICVWTFWLVTHSFKQFLQMRPAPLTRNTTPLVHLTYLVPLLSLHSGFSLLPDWCYFKCSKSPSLEVFPSLCTFSLKGASYKPWF